MAAASQIQDIAGLPGCTVIFGNVRLCYVARQLGKHILGHKHEVAFAGLDEIANRAAITLLSHFEFGPGLAFVETARNPNVDLNAFNGLILLRVPAPLQLRQIQEDQNQRSLARPKNRTLLTHLEIMTVLKE